jgi:hypothetical protein
VSTPEPSAAPDPSLAPPSAASADHGDATDFSDLTGAPVGPTERSRGARIARWAAIGTCVAIVGLWAFVYVWAARAKPVDKLGDPTFAHQAQKVCATTIARLAALPQASASKTNVARAAVVVQTNEELAQMLDQLEHIAPRTGTDGRMVRAWLDDYHTYLSNRVSYAQRLRTDPAARFYEAEKQPGEQISIPIDTLATANGMNSCTAPEDLS